MFANRPVVNIAAVVLLLWATVAGAGQEKKKSPRDQAAKNQNRKPDGKTVLYDGKVRVADKSYFLRLTSRRHNLTPEKAGKSPDVTNGWLLELTKRNTKPPQAGKPAEQLIWRYWFPELLALPRPVPHQADICAGRSGDEIYVAISYVEVFVIYRINTDGVPRPIPKLPEYAKSDPEVVAGGFPLEKEVTKKYGPFSLDTINIQAKDDLLTVTCNPAGTTRWEPAVRYTYNLKTKKWRWLKEIAEPGPTTMVADFPEPSRLWQQRDLWKIKVERHSGKKTGRPITYTLGVMASHRKPYEGVDCWNLFLTPLGNAPRSLARQCWLVIEKERGRLKKAKFFERKKFAPYFSLNPSPQGAFFAEPPDGFPLEYFTLSGPPRSVIPHGHATLTIHRRWMNEDELLVEATMATGEKIDFKIRQKWIKGEKWWREYERWQADRIVLRASLGVPPRNLKKIIAADKAAAKKAKSALKNIDMSLRQDGRLHASLSFQEKNIRLSNVLNELTEATGLTFTLADNLANHDPELGSWQLPSVAAWAVMETLTKRQLQNGHWQKTATGYQLVGTSTVPAAATPPQPSFWSHTLTLIVLAIAAIAFAALCGFAIFRKSARTTQPPAARQ